MTNFNSINDLEAFFSYLYLLSIPSLILNFAHLK